MPFNKNLFLAFQNISRTIEPNKAYQSIVTEASKIVGADFGSIYLSTSKDTLRRAYTTIPVKNRIRSRKDGYTYSALKNKRIELISNSKLELIHPESKEKNVHNIMVIPLMTENDSVGVITLLSKNSMKNDPKTLEQIKIFSTMACLVVRNVYTYEKVESSLEERDIYISMASHELKTPLTSISSYAQLSLNRFKKTGNVKQTHLENILSQTDRLNQLINDFLSLDSIHRGTFEFDFSEVSLIDVIESVISGFQIEYPNHRLQISYTFMNNQDDIWVWGDFHKLCQVFSNILNNAGKYSPESSLIQISVLVSTKQVTVSVADQGPGISDKEINKIFDLFYRSTEVKKSGTGIGLFLAKRIVAEHNGEIKVTPNIPNGSLFTVTLPLNNGK